MTKKLYTIYALIHALEIPALPAGKSPPAGCRDDKKDDKEKNNPEYSGLFLNYYLGSIIFHLSLIRLATVSPLTGKPY